jgi:hypothetical protein
MSSSELRTGEAAQAEESATAILQTGSLSSSFCRSPILQNRRVSQAELLSAATFSEMSISSQAVQHFSQ